MRSRMLLMLLALLAAAALFAASSPEADAAAGWPLTSGSLVVAGGPIDGLASAGNRVYVTGDFSEIGHFAGSGVELNADGVPNAGSPAVNGQISYVLARPGGGWFIAGDFTEVGGVQRSGLAELNANGTVDEAFDPTVNGQLVDSLALDGSSLFLGGSFVLVDGAPREGLAAVDTSTGGLLPFDAHQTGQTTELAFLPATATTPAVLYAGMGEVLALDPTTGDPIPGFHSSIISAITALAAGDGHLYVGGVGGVVALDPMTGVQDQTFSAGPVDLTGAEDYRGTVDSIVVEPDRVLVGGEFNGLGGARGPLVALDPDTGTADTSFRPEIRGSVYDMDQSGANVWVGGDFASAGGRPASNIVVLDASTGARQPVSLPRLNGQVNGIRVNGNQVYAGGEFDLVNPLQVHGFAEVQGTTGALNTSFTPPAPHWPILTVDADALISAPTSFQGYNPPGLPPFASTLTSVETLNPITGRHVPQDYVAVANLSGVAVSGPELFIDQRLGSSQRFPQNLVTVRSTRTGHILHRYRLPLRGYVTQLLVHDGTLYVAGSFKRTRPDGQLANLAILAVDPNTGTLNASFDPHANGPVYTLAAQGHELYFAGLFGRVDAARRPSIAALNLDDSYVDQSFDPKLHGTNNTSLTVLAGRVFAAIQYGPEFGYDDYLSSGPLSADTGALDPFISVKGTDSTLELATATPGGALIAGTTYGPLGIDYSSPLQYLQPVRGN